MSGAPAPVFIPEAFANDAGPTFRNTIPDTTIDTQRASWSQGFPALTMTPVIAGGKPPLGQDVNGTLYAISTHTIYQQAGQLYLYSTDVSTALGGYALGTILGSTTGKVVWFNIVDGNVTDPDGSGSTGWIPLDAYGLSPVGGVTGGVKTLTVAEASKDIIVLSGTLTSNSQVVLPTWVHSWLIVNNTSGSFSVTVKTAGGSGVTVGQGGFSAPVEVYGDGTNIYPTAAALSIPTSTGPDPNTYALRTGNGYLYAVYFNQSSAPENFTMSTIFAEAGGDGFLRKITPANFQAQLALQNFGGQVIAGQVPFSAISPLLPQIWSGPILTGAPIAPTPAAGDSSSRIATTAFVAGITSLLGNGFIKFSNGLILQWGFAQGAGGFAPLAVTWPTAFPTACLAAFCNTANRTTGGSAGTNFVSSLTTNGATLLFDLQTSGAGSGHPGGYFLAIGH